MADDTTLFERPALCANWPELQKCYEALSVKASRSTGPKWVFRGDKLGRTDCFPAGEVPKDALQLMQKQETKLRKALENYLPNRLKVRIGTREQGQIIKAEWELIRAFQRKLHLYSTHVPAQEDILEWLALMQHYQGPTRLLDYTYSFYMACYFALARIDPEKDVGIIWAVDAKWIEKCESEWLENDPVRGSHTGEWIQQTDFKGHLSYMDREGMRRNALLRSLLDCPDRVVLNLTPFQENDRLTIQQGTFLAPGSLGHSLCENLQGNWRIYHETDTPPVQCTIIGLGDKDPYRNRNDILCELRAMNISQEVLFPGLQGFAESLWHRLAYPWLVGDAEPSNP